MKKLVLFSVAMFACTLFAKDNFTTYVTNEHNAMVKKSTDTTLDASTKSKYSTMEQAVNKILKDTKALETLKTTVQNYCNGKPVTGYSQETFTYGKDKFENALVLIKNPSATTNVNKPGDRWFIDKTVDCASITF